MGNLRICHISDTHGPKNHSRLVIPECDVLIHSGDIGGRTGSKELYEFLKWFQAQSAKKKIWCAGNHDIIMDSKFLNDKVKEGIVGKLVAQDLQAEALRLLTEFSDITYLKNTDYVYEGVKFWGSPMSPSFHRQHWAFNADRGEEISKYWNKIPNDVDVLITHGPPYGILDEIPTSFKSTPDEDVHRGCEDLLRIMKKRLHQLKLHCFGHIHDGPTGVVVKKVSNTRSLVFSNGAVLNNDYQLVVTQPLIITL